MSRKAAALFNPTEEHAQLRTLAASFAKNTIGPQAAEFDKKVYPSPFGMILAR